MKTPAPPNRPRPLRTHLLRVVLGGVLPVALFATFIAVQLGRSVQLETERRLLSTAAAISTAFDREIAASVRALDLLGRSPFLGAKFDAVTFYDEALRAKESQPSWKAVALHSSTGELLVRTDQPVGAEPGPVLDPESLERAIQSGRPALGSLRRGRPPTRWSFALRVPVLRDGAVRYVLTAVFSSEAVEGLVRAPDLQTSPGFVRTVIDARGAVVVRTREAERFVGVLAPQAFLDAVGGHAREGIVETESLEGVESYVAYHRSTEWGWTAAMVESRSVVLSPLSRYLALTTGFGLFALGASVAFALLLARRIRAGIGRASTAAEGLARGEWTAAPPTGISEVDRLNQLLERSAQLLSAHELEGALHRARLEDAVRARDEFLSLASHELKTPLTTLVLDTQRIDRRLRKESEPASIAVAPLLDGLRRHTGRIARLVDDMLDISRLQTGNLSLRRKSFDLVEAARASAERVWAQLNEPRPELTIDGGIPVIGNWDPDRIDQALTNLLTNAARYGNGKPVRVSVRAEGSTAIVEVIDQGSGIALADQQRIFEKFERAVNRNEVSGLGLGLFIVRNIVELHGGTVSVGSRIGEGSCFTVRLPGVGQVASEPRTSTGS